MKKSKISKMEYRKLVMLRLSNHSIERVWRYLEKEYWNEQKALKKGLIKQATIESEKDGGYYELVALSVILDDSKLTVNKIYTPVGKGDWDISYTMEMNDAVAKVKHKLVVPILRKLKKQRK